MSRKYCANIQGNKKGTWRLGGSAEDADILKIERAMEKLTRIGFISMETAGHG